jgi:D-alanyl-lipoteichoic acid acyltransferase DltB (MBOAT superfamily)
MLTLAMDTSMIAGLAVAAAFTLVLVAIPALTQIRGFWLLPLLAAIAYYRHEFVGFALVSGLSYLAVYCLARVKPPHRWRWGCFAILLLGVVFTWGRIGHWDRPVALPGIGPLVVYSLGMWPVLKLVTLFWEVGSGSITAPSPTQYLIWVCLPFTLGGPILRWSQMPIALIAERKLLRTAGWWLEAAAASVKLLVGVLLGVGQSFLSSHWHSHWGNNAVGMFLSAPMGFYLTSAGYFHWMELLARPCGLKVPPSYNSPVGRENISAFWMNWNMTATFVFRDYLFFNRWGRRNYNVYFNTILLFTLVGLWHAANPYWILWGFLHGLLFCSFLLWRKYGQRFENIPLRGTLASRTAARVFTYFTVCMCWYLPSKIIQQLGGL